MSYLAYTTLVIRDYDEALAFYVVKLGFELVEDTYSPSRTSAGSPSARSALTRTPPPSSPLRRLSNDAPHRWNLERLRPRRHAPEDIVRGPECLTWL
jgi:catechol 2,3-dioxygenase-like lactoylglutathione lyase family enzyme